MPDPHRSPPGDLKAKTQRLQAGQLAPVAEVEGAEEREQPFRLGVLPEPLKHVAATKLGVTLEPSREELLQRTGTAGRAASGERAGIRPRVALVLAVIVAGHLPRVGAVVAGDVPLEDQPGVGLEQAQEEVDVLREAEGLIERAQARARMSVRKVALCRAALWKGTWRGSGSGSPAGSSCSKKRIAPTTAATSRLAASLSICRRIRPAGREARRSRGR